MPRYTSIFESTFVSTFVADGEPWDRAEFSLKDLRAALAAIREAGEEELDPDFGWSYTVSGYTQNKGLTLVIRSQNVAVGEQETANWAKGHAAKVISAKLDRRIVCTGLTAIHETRSPVTLPCLEHYSPSGSAYVRCERPNGHEGLHLTQWQDAYVSWPLQESGRPVVAVNLVFESEELV